MNLGRYWELLSQDIRRSFALLGFRDATRAEAKFFGTASREARCGLWDGPHPQPPSPSSPSLRALVRKRRGSSSFLMRSLQGQKPALRPRAHHAFERGEEGLG